MRILLAVDIQNLFCGCRDTYGRRARVDYRKLIEAAVPCSARPQALARAYLVGKRKQDDSAFIAMLESFGYTVRKRVLEEQGADWDTGMVVETMRDIDDFDRLVLASGDGDFESLVRQLQARGKHVTVMAFPKCLNERLATAADKVVKLEQQMFVWKGGNGDRK